MRGFFVFMKPIALDGEAPTPRSRSAPVTDCDDWLVLVEGMDVRRFREKNRSSLRTETSSSKGLLDGMAKKGQWQNGRWRWAG